MIQERDADDAHARHRRQMHAKCYVSNVRWSLCRA
jgi:hypothetical protein